MEITYRGPDAEMMTSPDVDTKTTAAGALKDVAEKMHHFHDLDSVTIIFNETIEPPKPEGLYSSLLHSRDMLESAMFSHIDHRQRQMTNNALISVRTLLNDIVRNAGELNVDTQHIETETD